jgi:HSP20 family protein
MWLTHRSNQPAVADLPAMASRINRIFDEALRAWPGLSQDENGSLVSAWLPPVDVTENKEAVTITAEVPGMQAEDVKLSLENNTLTIRGEKRQERQETAERVHRYERSYGLFERSFTLPATVDADRISAAYQNGVLTVTLPKVERARPREIAVNAARS